MATAAAKEMSRDFSATALEEIARECDKRREWLESNMDGSVRDALYQRDANRFGNVAAAIRELLMIRPD